jgi:hypothetical protein
MKNTLLLIWLLLIPFTAQAMQGWITANGGYDQITGLAQTPKGGQPGTTTLDKPTFADLGIHHAGTWELGLGIDHHGYVAQLQYRKLGARGSKTLNQDLITHDRLITAGNQFHLQVDYDWSSLGIGKAIPFYGFVLTPMLAANWIWYEYDYHSIPAASNRAFTFFGGTFGAILRKDWQRWGFDLEAKLPIPANNVQLYTFKAGIDYQLFQSVHHIRELPRLSVECLRVDYEDEQTIPNHIRYQVAPGLLAGLTVIFS